MTTEQADQLKYIYDRINGINLDTNLGTFEAKGTVSVGSSIKPSFDTQLLGYDNLKFNIILWNCPYLHLRYKTIATTNFFNYDKNTGVVTLDQQLWNNTADPRSYTITISIFS